MSRRDLILAVCALTVGAAALVSYHVGRDPVAVADAKKEPAPAKSDFVVAPYLQFATPRSITEVIDALGRPHFIVPGSPLTQLF